MTSTLQSHEHTLRYIDIHKVAQSRGADVRQLPYVIRVFLENLCRHQAWGAAVSDAEIDAVLQWQDHIGAELPLHVARVILPDSSGLPVLQDLAALRDAVAKQGGDVDAVDTRVPVDLIVDHSLQVDHWGDALAQARNLEHEFHRNHERYQFLKWAQQAFPGLRVFPPGTGIIHQVNLEYIASVVARQTRADGTWAFPDFVIGADSHTPMINALGVLGWGVGGIDAEAALLGMSYSFPVPEVVGVELIGAIAAPAMTTDAALLITQTLRQAGVTGCMVEFFGPAVCSLTVQERATIANMAPEYGATCGFFPIDERTLEYLLHSGRNQEQLELVKRYSQKNYLYRDSHAVTPTYKRVLQIDLSQARSSMAGPSRPQDRMTLDVIADDFRARLSRPISQGGFGVAPASLEHSSIPESPPKVIAHSNGQSGKNSIATRSLTHGSVVLAAITSCTNTSNPSVMIAAGLLARKAVALGIAPPAWVKTSLAPGSRAVTRYLSNAGLLSALETLGFHVIGYGCTTCGGKSGPLDTHVAQEIEQNKWVVASALSGNRNFEGRIHKLIRANYIGAPPMVVAYALAGRIDIDFEREPIAHNAEGQPVFLSDIWPSQAEIAQLQPLANQAELFRDTYDPRDASTTMWDQMQAASGKLFPWDPSSHYLVEPPFFKTPPHADGLSRLALALQATRVLAAFDDSLTTDHISPGGEIPIDTPAGQYLSAAGIAPADFNSYVSRRCNYEVMSRATFANIRIKNCLLPDVEGGFTRHFPSGEQMSIFDAATRYKQEAQNLIILAGKDYGTGSSRDWAAKGSALLGVQAVIAESFERIHRANLVGMGIVPLTFMAGQGWRQLGLTGSEVFQFQNVENGIEHGQPIDVIARDGKQEICFQVQSQVLTLAERQLMAQGGIPASVLNSFLPKHSSMINMGHCTAASNTF